MTTLAGDGTVKIPPALVPYVGLEVMKRK